MKSFTVFLFLLSYIAYVQGGQGELYRPVVLWHGMGDTCCGEESMVKVQQVIKDTLPGIYTYSIMLGEDEDQDKKFSYFGNVNDQVEQVCQILKKDENLKGGFNAIGFSQGGQFLRAYVQRCNDPPIHNLITFGSQHAGISDIPGCSNNDKLCQLMRAIARRGAYSNYVRSRIVQAQYYKDPGHLDTYLQQNIFLPDINNEFDIKNETYKTNLKSLNKFVLIRFTEDITVKPRDSAWFSFYNTEGDLLTLHQQPIYIEDWIGLRDLDEKGKLEFKDCEGSHMQIPLEYLQLEVILPYLSFDSSDKNGNFYDNIFEQARKKLNFNIQE